MNTITEKDIKKAYEEFYYSQTHEAICPKPTRFFNVGDSVRVGNLDDAVVRDIVYGESGSPKAYLVEYTKKETRDASASRNIGVWWWYEVDDINFCDINAQPLFKEDLPGQVSTIAISSLLFKMSSGGIVCDPRYQRSYVWTIENQEAFIDSIFNRINIGTFVFSRNAGYKHKDDNSSVTYINLDGDEITIPKNKDYTEAVIDGQQRLTTIWRYVTNQFQYKGRFWKDLCFHDQIDFNNTLLSSRTFDEETVTYKDVLEMFINVNRGVPQDESHLDMVKKEYEMLK